MQCNVSNNRSLGRAFNDGDPRGQVHWVIFVTSRPGPVTGNTIDVYECYMSLTRRPVYSKTRLFIHTVSFVVMKYIRAIQRFNSNTPTSKHVVSTRRFLMYTALISRYLDCKNKTRSKSCLSNIDQKREISSYLIFPRMESMDKIHMIRSMFCDFETLAASRKYLH